MIAHQSENPGGDFYQANTTPTPVVKFKEQTAAQESHLGVPGTDNPPDLAVNPIAANSGQENGTTQQKVCPKSPSAAQEPKLKGILKNDSKMAATAGRSPPGDEDPSSKPPVPNELRPVPPPEAPCYMPQPQDALPDTQTGEMGPIGPWATGRVDWGPLAGLTGTRPVVDKYSITRYSEGEWRQHNKEMLDLADTETHRANL